MSGKNTGRGVIGFLAGIGLLYTAADFCLPATEYPLTIDGKKAIVRESRLSHSKQYLVCEDGECTPISQLANKRKMKEEERLYKAFEQAIAEYKAR